MEVSLERQAFIFQVMEDFLEKWTTYDLLVKRLTVNERELMFEWMDKLRHTLHLPTTSLRQENVKMAHVGTIVQRKAKETIPEDALDIFTGTNDQYAGYALPEDGEVSIGQLDDAKADIQQTMKDNENPFFVMCAKGADSEESKQPFNTLQNEGGNCICATFIEGDLQGFGAPESSHSIEYAAHQEYLQAKIIDIFASCGEDLQKTIEKLSSALVRREIANICFPTPDGRGEILLVFANGQTVNIIKGDKHQKYPWGEVSQALGYAEKPVATAEPVKPKGMGKKPVVAAKEPDNKALAAAFVKATNDKANADHGKQTNLKFKIRPPAEKFSSFKELQGWYKAFGHKEDQPGSDALSATVGKFHLAIPVQVKAEINNDTFNALLTNNKIFLATDQPKQAPGVVKPEAVIPVSIIPTAEIEKAKKEFWPKVTKAMQNYDDGSRLIVPPDKAAEYTKTRPVATEQMGFQMGLEEFEQLSADAWRMLQKVAPETIISILMQYQYQRYMDHRAVKEATNIKKAM